MMITKGTNGYCLQETWKLRKYTTTIREHIIFHHGTEENNDKKGRISIGVAIILGQSLLQDWTLSGKPPPITSPSNSNFLGIMIGVTLSFPKKSNITWDKYNWKAKGEIKIPILYLSSSKS